MINLVNGGGNEGSEIYSFHTGGGLFVFGDASVRFIREDVDEDAFLSLATAANEDVVNWGKVD